MGTHAWWSCTAKTGTPLQPHFAKEAARKGFTPKGTGKSAGNDKKDKGKGKGGRGQGAGYEHTGAPGAQEEQPPNKKAKKKSGKAAGKPSR